jgi:hypothetical protein
MNFDQLVDLCHRTHEELGSRAIRAADAHLVVRNWLFGLYITEFEQNGTDRAAYGARVIESLADRLSPLKVKGTSATRLKLYRSFYRIFSIGPTLSDQLQKLLPNAPEKSPTVSDLSSKERNRALSSLPSGLMSHFALGWSHYVELLTISGDEERRFYEIEAAANQWSVRELQRQIASSLYQRLALSRDKLTHQDLGQMQMYVNYFDRHVKLPDESPTVGILLCHRKNDALVELTLPSDTNIFASKYQLYLPSKEELKARLESITTSLDDSRRADR